MKGVLVSIVHSISNIFKKKMLQILRNNPLEESRKIHKSKFGDSLKFGISWDSKIRQSIEELPTLEQHYLNANASIKARSKNQKLFSYNLSLFGNYHR